MASLSVRSQLMALAGQAVDHSGFIFHDMQNCVASRAYTYVYIYDIIMCVYIHTHTYTYLSIHPYISMYILYTCFTYIHTYIHAYVRTYIHTYIHTYIRTYIHTYIHTYFLIPSLSALNETLSDCLENPWMKLFIVNTE